MCPCLQNPIQPKRVAKADFPMVKEAPKETNVKEVPKEKEEKKQEQQINNKLKWWHIAVAFLAGFCLATMNTKKV